jgi:hypothetical protein
MPMSYIGSLLKKKAAAARFDGASGFHRSHR